MLYVQDMTLIHHVESFNIVSMEILTQCGRRFTDSTGTGPLTMTKESASGVLCRICEDMEYPRRHVVADWKHEPATPVAERELITELQSHVMLLEDAVKFLQITLQDRVKDIVNNHYHSQGASYEVAPVGDSGGSINYIMKPVGPSPVEWLEYTDEEGRDG